MSWIRRPVIGGWPVVLPPLFCGSLGVRAWKSATLLSVSVVPPRRSKELLLLVVGVVNPVPSRQGLFGEPTPSRTVPVVSTILMPAKFVAAKSVMPVPYSSSASTVPE